MTKDQRSVLDWLRERRDKAGNALITEEEFAAGDRLRQDFFRGQMAQRVTASWSPATQTRRRRRDGAAVGPDFREGTLAAQDRVRKALAAVQPEHARLLFDVCCLDGKLTEVERRNGWPQRSGKVILQMALLQLARHYGFLPSRIPSDWGSGQVATGVRHWGSQGYRPHIGGFEPAATGKGGEHELD